MIPGFLAAVLSLLSLHQGTVWLLSRLTLLDVPAGVPVWNLDPNTFGLPVLASQSLFAGLYGAAYGWIAPRRQLLGGLLTGVAASLIGLFLVAPLKGAPLAGGGDPLAWARPLVVNGIWGIGIGLLHPILSRLTPSRDRSGTAQTGGSPPRTDR